MSLSQGVDIVDSGWVKDVRANGNGVKIVPRLLFEGWSVNDYMNLFADQGTMRDIAEYIAHRVEVFK